MSVIFEGLILRDAFSNKGVMSELPIESIGVTLIK